MDRDQEQTFVDRKAPGSWCFTLKMEAAGSSEMLIV